MLGSGDRRTEVCTATSNSCVDHDVPAAAARRYLVTAWVGVAWHQTGRPLTVWTAPPAPTLAFADGDGADASTLVVTASGAVSDYDVDLFADGTPFHPTRVSAGVGTSRTVAAPGFGAGHHRLVAVSRFHGWRASSATLTVAVSSDGVAEPGPSEAPVPVSSDSPSDSAAPPTAPLPTSSSPAIPTRTSAPPVVVVKTGPVVRPAPAPAPSAPPQIELGPSPSPNDSSAASGSPSCSLAGDGTIRCPADPT